MADLPEVPARRAEELVIRQGGGIQQSVSARSLEQRPAMARTREGTAGSARLPDLVRPGNQPAERRDPPVHLPGA